MDYEEGLLLEIKTHGKHPTLAVYEAQMQLYMDQLGLDFGWLALYERPDNFDIEFDRDRLEIKEIKRDEVYVQKIYDAIETFWIRCEYLKENPDMTEQEYLSTGTDMDVAISRLNKVAPQLEKLRKQIK
ncbi:hypothetical protein QP202_24540, partial [Escherichia coli]|nr:hypothetical protein [Escherichia coli]